MSNFFIIRQTKEEWEAEDISWPDNYIGVESDIVNGVETGSLKAKIFNGHTPWNDLDYWDVSGGTLVTGADFSVNNNVAVFADSSGKLIKDIGIPIDSLADNESSQTFSNKKINISGDVTADGNYDGLQITGREAAATIAQWEAVVMHSTGWSLADASGTDNFPARGLATASYAISDVATILTYGTVRNDAWNWNPGGSIYLSETPGALTQTLPSRAQEIGWALDTHQAFLHFHLAAVSGPPSPPPDNPPTVPQNLRITGFTDTTIEFAWDASTD